MSRLTSERVFGDGVGVRDCLGQKEKRKGRGR